MRKRSALRRSTAVSALLLAALFLLPLLVTAPFRRTLFNRELPVDETEAPESPRQPFESGNLDAARFWRWTWGSTWWGWFGRRCPPPSPLRP